ncbi:fibronectin type III domain-containing protein [Paenibacillus sp. 2TAB19]|uniref:fibronectin type III domain-containing protein n=1 Tax=Paenibacillus sp. 2TAB19 TaxID=3233003 RepID=UPI003F9A2522
MKQIRFWLTALLVVVLVLPASMAFAAASNGGEKELSSINSSVSNEQINLPNTKFIEGIQSKALNNDQSVLDFVNSNASVQGLAANEKQFSIESKVTDNLGQEHYMLQQSYNGIPIYGRYLQVNLNNDQEVYAIQDKSDNGLNLSGFNTVAKLSESEAIQSFKEKLEIELNGDIKLEEKIGKYQFPSPTAEILIYPFNGKTYLVYEVNLVFMFPSAGNWVGYVDAHTGQLIDQFNKIQNATGTGVGNDGKTKNLNTTLYDSQYILWDQTHKGGISTFEFSYFSGNRFYYDDLYSYSNYFDDADAVDAHYNADVVYDFYKEHYNRDSIDGKGMEVISFVHMPEYDGSFYGQPLDNAYWNGSAMFYGDGTGKANGGFDCLSCGLDVVAHELTHGVTEKTVGLVYRSQSGALNESISDIMASVIDNDDWLMGEDTGYTLRSLANPALYGDPAHMDNYRDWPVTEEGDWGGVHTNSGIPNKAAYNMATKFSTLGYDGRALLGKLTYAVLSNKYLMKTSGFSDARNAYLLAVGSVTGYTTEQKTAIKQAVSQGWAEVGIGVPISDLVVTSKNANSVQFAWTGAIAATNVQIEQSFSKTSGYSPSNIVVDPDGNTATINELTTGKTYYFRINVTGGANKGLSNVVTVGLVPGKVNSFALDSKTYDTATFNWNLTDRPESIQIEQSVNGTTWTPSIISAPITMESTSSTVLDLVTGTTYKFRLKVSGSAYSGTTVSTILSVPITPVALSGLLQDGAATGSSVKLKWTAAVGATGIIVQQSNNAGKTWTTAKTATIGVNDSSTTVNELLSGTEYKFRLNVTSGRNAGTSNEITATTASEPLKGLASGTVTSSTITLNWPLAVRATGLVIEQSEAGENNWKLANTGTVKVTAVSVVVKGLLPNTSYDFRMKVTGGANAGDSNLATGKTSAVKLTSFSNDKTVATTATTARFKWTAAAGATGYSVQQSTDGINWSTSITSGLTSSSTGVTVTGLTPNKSYQFLLRTAGGQNEGDSNIVTVKTLPSPIQNITANPTGEYVTLNWSAAKEATKVVVQQSLNGTSWTTAVTLSPVAANANQAQVTKLLPGTQYYFRVVVTGGQNEGNSASAPATTNIVPVSSLAVSSTTINTVNLSWTAAYKATGLIVMQSVDGGETWTNALTSSKVAASAKSATVKDLVPNKQYQFKIVVTGGGNVGDSNSATGVTKSIPIKAFASTGKTGITATTADFKWPQAIGADALSIQVSLDGKVWTSIEATPVVDESAVTAQVANLRPNTKYYFQLNVVGGQNQGISNVVNVTTLPQPISDLEVIEDSETSSKVSLQWTAAVKATKLLVQQSNNNGKTWTTANVGTLALNASSAVVNGLAADTAYQFRIIVTGGENVGTSAIAEGSTIKAPVDSLAVSATTTSSVSLVWTPAANATSVVLQYKESEGGGEWLNASAKLTASSKSATVSGLKVNTTYEFQLVVVGGGNEGTSDLLVTNTKSIPLTSLAYKSKTTNSVTLGWKAALNADSVSIWYSIDGVEWNQIEVDAGDSSVTVTDLETYVSYKFKLVVVGGTNEGTSNIVTVKTNR